MTTKLANQRRLGQYKHETFDKVCHSRLLSLSELWFFPIKMAKRSRGSDDSIKDYDLLSIDNQDETVKRVYFKEYQDLTPSGELI